MNEATEVKRGPGRPPTANREPMHMTRTRRRRYSNTEDRYALPLDEIPEGSSYEWKRFSVKGEEDPFYLTAQREQGWEPVDPKRHPNWLPDNFSGSAIIKDGLILMERPMELTLQAREEQETSSRKQVRDQEKQLMQRPADHPFIKPKVKSEMMRQVVSED
jgi:hypothetical protein